MFNLVLDATECEIQRPSDYVTQKRFYSGKSKMHSVKYELGVQIVSGLICWLAGGCPGSVHDYTVTKNNGLLSCLLPGELVLADKGYVGDASIVTPVRSPANDTEWDTNVALSSVR